MSDRNLENVLSTCVDRYLGGEWTLEDCLVRYPNHTQLIRNYLAVSDALRDLVPRPPSQAALSFGERLVLGELDRLVESRPTGSGPRRLAGRLGRLLVASRLATATAVVLLAMLLGSGVTLAASVSGPASPLYGYKLTLDRVRIELTPEDRKADVYIDVAERRLREMEHVVLSEGGKGIDRISADYTQMLNQGLGELTSLSNRAAADQRQRFVESRSNFNNRLEGQRRRLELMAPAGETEVREVVNTALQNAEANLSRLPTAHPDVRLAEARSPAPTAIPPQSSVTATPAATTVPVPPPTTTPLGSSTAATVLAPPGDDGNETADQTDSTNATAQASPQPTDVPPPAAEVSPAVTSPPPAPTQAPPTEIVEIEGLVTAMGRSTLLVDGRKVVLDANVVPNPIVRGKPVVGGTVRIRGILSNDGVIFLVELQTLPGEDAVTPSTATATLEPTPDATVTPEPEFQISGSVTAVTGSLIEVDGRAIDISELLEAGALSQESLELGTNVEVKGYVQPGNVLTATEITLKDSQPESGAEDASATPDPESTTTADPTLAPSETPTPVANQVTIEGVLTAADETSIEIDGQTITVVVGGADATDIEGNVEVGTTASVSVVLQEDGTLVAASITIQSPEITPTSTPTIVETEDAPLENSGDAQDSSGGS